MKSSWAGLMAAVLIGFPAAHAGYLVEIDTDGFADAIITWSPDFTFGGDTNTAFQSIKATPIGLTGGDSIFGGNGSALPDNYVFTYAPDAQTDNQYLDTGMALGDGNFWMACWRRGFPS